MRFWLLALSCLSALYGQSNDGPFPAHKVAGNVYYVGSKMLSSYLITTPEGHILINTSFDQTVPLIKASVEKLGFKFEDIRILLTSHAHDDHCAGNALVKSMTGAKVYVMDGDQDVVASGGKGAIQHDGHWKPVSVDRVLHDGDEVKLGGSVLVAHRTPGHTKGCTTWTMVATEGGRKYNVLVLGSPNVNPDYILVNNSRYPQIASDYAHMFTVLKTLPCDIFLGAHGAYYDLDAKYARLKQGGSNPFMDPEGYRRLVDLKEKEFQQKLAVQTQQKR